MARFICFWHKRQPHLQLTFSDPIGELLRVVTILAGTDTILLKVFYSSLEISDSTLNNPWN